MTRARWHVSQASTSPSTSGSEIGLTYIYGIGDSPADSPRPRPDVDPDTYVKDLTEDEVRRLRKIVDDLLTSRAICAASVAEHQAADGDRLLTRACGTGAACRSNGQRTKTNARSRKGPKRMGVGGGKKKVRKH